MEVIRSVVFDLTDVDGIVVAAATDDVVMDVDVDVTAADVAMVGSVAVSVDVDGDVDVVSAVSDFEVPCSCCLLDD